MIRRADFDDILNSSERKSFGNFLAAYVMKREQRQVKTSTPNASAREIKSYDYTRSITNFYNEKDILVVAEERLKRVKTPLRKAMLEKVIKRLSILIEESE